MTTNNEDLIKTFIEVKLKDENDFRKIRETLTRVGIASRKDNVLFQSCHILHKKGRYYIVHFKEMFALDGKPTNFTEEDRARRNKIVMLLKDWSSKDSESGFHIEILSPAAMLQPQATMNHIKVIPFRDKANWRLEAKYSIGAKKVTVANTA